MIFAWSGILLATGLIIVMQASSRSRGQTGRKGMSRMEQSVITVEAKYLVGIATWLGFGADPAIKTRLQEWEPEDPEQQIRVAVIAGELIGPQAAIDRLQETRTEIEEQEVPSSLPLLLGLYTDYSQNKLDAPSLDSSQRNELTDRLGWFGELALSPEGSDAARRDELLGSAQNVVIAILLATAMWLLGGMLGLLVLGYVLAQMVTGRGRLEATPRRGTIYGETFAIWIVAFVLLSLLIGLVASEERSLTASVLVFVISGTTAFWPLWRGVSWQELCHDVGWTRGRGIFRELFSGIACYLMALPVVVFCYVISYLVMRLFADDLFPTQSPIHPIFERSEDSGPIAFLPIAIIACVIAPLMEETMFRGFLYRHMREASVRMRSWVSIGISSVVTSLIFAIIHPQGVLALPGIFGLAVAFSFTREWRESLIAPMMGHCINNSVAVTALFFLMAQ